MEATERPNPAEEPTENPDRTQPVSPPASTPVSDRTEALSRPDESAAPISSEDSDRTQAVPRPSPEPAAESPALSQEEQDRRLASELARRGVPPDEIQRLVALGRGETPQPTAKPKTPAIPTPPPIPPSEAYVPKPTITLPEFREATTQQRIEADRLLTTANIARRRGIFKEAEKACREAIELVPKDAAALELYGDIFQSVGRVDDALYAYERAKEADPSRRTAEKKYAELMLMQNREIDLLRDEFLPRNPNVAILLSAVFPGAGQLYNGDTLKGLVIVLISLVCVVVLFWTPYGLPHRQAGIPASLVLCLVVATIVYIYAVVDANLSARRGKRPRSGWEV